MKPYLGGYKEGQRYILMPDGAGKVHIVDLFEYDPDYRFDAYKSVAFILHTRFFTNYMNMFEIKMYLFIQSFIFTLLEKVLHK